MAVLARRHLNAKILDISLWNTDRCNACFLEEPTRNTTKYISKPYNYFEFVFGFQSNAYLCILRNTLTSDGRVSQICKYCLYSYMEAKLQCHNSENLVTATEFFS